MEEKDQINLELAHLHYVYDSYGIEKDILSIKLSKIGQIMLY